MTAKTKKTHTARQAAKQSAAATPPLEANKSRHLQLKDVPGTTRARLLTDIVSHGVLGNAASVVWFASGEIGDLSLTEMVASLGKQGEAVNRGDLSSAERLLHAQAVTLNTIFGELARRAALNMGEHLGATEAYMRLALRAQGQCRSTLETLAAIKNPLVVFARQANINNGGQQQVNNGVRAGGAGPPAPAGENQSEPNKLLDACDVERLDFGAQSEAGGTHKDLAPVGARDRAAN